MNIQAKKGFILFCIVALGIIGAMSFLILLFVPANSSSGQSIMFEVGWGILVVFIFAFIATSNLTRQTIISQQSILDFGPFGRAEYPMQGCTKVLVLPMYGNTIFFGWNIFIQFQDKGQFRGTTIYASLYANRHDLVKAVIEAAYLSNPKVEIDRSLLRSYGLPPYGIFKDKG